MLRLTADHGHLTAADELNVVVIERPVIRTGSTLQVPLQASLPGEISDDGLGDPRSGVIRATWSKKSRTGQMSSTRPTNHARRRPRSSRPLPVEPDGGQRLAQRQRRLDGGGNGPLDQWPGWPITFEDGQGELVHDVSLGLKEPLDLIVVPTSTYWDVHSLALTAPGLLLGETPHPG